MTVSVVPESGGAPVRTLASDVSAPSTTQSNGSCSPQYPFHYWDWDGKTDAGVVAADGRYRVVVNAVDAQGDTGTVDFLTEVITKSIGSITARDGCDAGGTRPPCVHRRRLASSVWSSASPALRHWLQHQ